MISRIIARCLHRQGKKSRQMHTSEFGCKLGRGSVGIVRSGNFTLFRFDDCYLPRDPSCQRLVLGSSEFKLTMIRNELSLNLSIDRFGRVLVVRELDSSREAKQESFRLLLLVLDHPVMSDVM